MLRFMADELLKIAAEGNIYRKVQGGMLDREVPVLRTVPQDDAGRKKLIEAIEGSANTRWSHPQVAVRKMDLEGLGFKPTRMAIPLPGEAPGTTSWRSGELHAHKSGPVFLVHKDAKPPKGVIGNIRHFIEDVPPAISKLVGGAPPPFVPEGS